MSAVVYTLPRLFQPIENTPVSAGIYPMKRISDYFNHDGNKDVEAMVMLSPDFGLLIVFYKFLVNSI